MSTGECVTYDPNPDPFRVPREDPFKAERDSLHAELRKSIAQVIELEQKLIESEQNNSELRGVIKYMQDAIDKLQARQGNRHGI